MHLEATFLWQWNVDSCFASSFGGIGVCALGFRALEQKITRWQKL